MPRFYATRDITTTDLNTISPPLTHRQHYSPTTTNIRHSIVRDPQYQPASLPAEIGTLVRLPAPQPGSNPRTEHSRPNGLSYRPPPTSPRSETNSTRPRPSTKVVIENKVSHIKSSTLISTLRSPAHHRDEAGAFFAARPRSTQSRPFLHEEGGRIIQELILLAQLKNALTQLRDPDLLEGFSASLVDACFFLYLTSRYSLSGPQDYLRRPPTPSHFFSTASRTTRTYQCFRVFHCRHTAHPINSREKLTRCEQYHTL